MHPTLTPAEQMPLSTTPTFMGEAVEGEAEQASVGPNCLGSSLTLLGSNSVSWGKRLSLTLPQWFTL